MVGYRIHEKVSTGSYEIKKSQHEEIYSVTNIVNRTVCTTKGALRINKPIKNATTGLPKCRKTYGDGGPIIAVGRIESRRYTTRVMSRECEVVQRIDLRTLNLETGQEESNHNNEKMKIYQEI